jgi:hypothetical protein
MDIHELPHCRKEALMTNRFTRLALTAALALGTVGATLGAAPASANPGPGPGPGWYGYHPGPHDGWRDRYGHWHPYGRWDRGPRWFDRAHGYWRDRLGYWNPHSGFYVSFRF